MKVVAEAIIEQCHINVNGAGSIVEALSLKHEGHTCLLRVYLLWQMCVVACLFGLGYILCFILLLNHIILHTTKYMVGYTQPNRTSE